ncbi:aldehyde dehydrogenase family protein [Sphingobium bisphenolivorans]|uniref:aldehyde dehydrogenase family protein n=1 Tax=Sphingobium bisphenolivorans TaxID=1335760 RepID=UPI0003A72C77|nr:aldehyde dehydrogenase family protein [Sphingobium bisphenolivorans]
MREYRKFYIDGEWVDPLSATDFTVVNPATEEAFATIALGSAQDVGRAVKAARAAFATFSETPVTERIALLEKVAQAIGARRAQIAAAVTEELGTPVNAMIHVDGSIAVFREQADILESYAFEASVRGNIVRKEPIGVAGMITAWNWPVQLLCTKLSAALAAGCTVVAKPSEFTSITAIALTEALHDAGVPKGVFNLVLGDGPTVGAAITQHPDIDLVSFTGSTRAGVLVAQAAAPTVKRVCQELGGKSANIILPDADLSAAVQWNIARAFQNTGQSCHAPSRMLVQRDQLPEVIDHIRAAVDAIVVGDPLSPETSMGPVVNKAQFDRVNSYIKVGIDGGARLLCGGTGRPAGLDRGYFIRPTVFVDVVPHMTIAQEEIFGPVLAVITYDDVEEAIQIANDTAYGLGAYVFTNDPRKGMAIGRRLRAGRVFLNGKASNMAAPMGGYKQSGNGREMGVHGLEEYLEIKAMIGFEAAV